WGPYVNSKESIPLFYRRIENFATQGAADIAEKCVQCAPIFLCQRDKALGLGRIGDISRERKDLSPIACTEVVGRSFEFPPVNIGNDDPGGLLLILAARRNFFRDCPAYASGGSGHYSPHIDFSLSR